MMTTMLAVLWLSISWSPLPLYQVESECWTVAGFGQAAVPAGTVPNNVEMCVFLNTTKTVDLPGFPCGQYVEFRDSTNPSIPYPFGRLRVFPEPDTPSLGQGVRVGFLAWTMLIDQLPPGGLSLNEMEILYISENNDIAYTKSIHLDDYPSIIFTYDGFMGLEYEYEVHFVEFTTPHTSDTEWSHGSFEFRAPLDNGVENLILSLGVASIRIVGIGDPMPSPCIPGPSTPTPTFTPTGIWPTLTPTLTPTGVWYTPTPSRTPFPTSIQTTAIPTPTHTPVVFNTLPPINTPTRYPTISLSNIVFPTVQFPTLPPIATMPPPTVGSEGTPTPIVAIPGQINLSPVEMMMTQWAGVIDYGEEAANPENEYGDMTVGESLAFLMAPATPPAGDYGVYAPQEVVVVAGAFGQIVAFVKSVQLYLPTIWPTVLGLLVSFGLIIALQVIKFAVQLAFIVVEWTRRLWEAIPFN